MKPSNQSKYETPDAVITGAASPQITADGVFIVCYNAVPKLDRER